MKIESSIYDSKIPMELPLLAGPGGSLARAAAADGKLFSVSGRRAMAWGSGLRGVEGISAAGWTVSELDAGLGPASNVLVEPHSVRRELAGARGTVLETLLLGVRVPAAILQWRRPQGSSAALELALSWKVSRDVAREVGADPRFDHLSLFAWEPPALAKFFGVVFARPAPDRWDIQSQGDSLRVSVHLRTPPGGALSVIFAFGEDSAERAASLRVMAAPRIEEVRAEQALTIARETGLSIRTGVASWDEGLEWAKARTRAAIAEVPNGRTDLAGDETTPRVPFERRIRRGGGPCRPAVEQEPPDDPSAGDPTPRNSASPFSPLAEECWVGLGALAAGDPEPAEVVLDGEYTTPYHLLLAARYVAWTGSATPLQRHVERLDAAVALAATAEGLRGVGLIALRELADTWEAVGEKDRAASLRMRVGRSAEPRGSGRRLPMVAVEDEPRDEEELVAALLSQDAGTFYRAPPSAPRGALDRALRAWASCRSGDPEAGWTLMDNHLTAGQRAAFGMWSEESAEWTTGAARRAGSSCPDHTASAALVPCAVLFGLLGGTADAPLGRIRLSPRFPSSWGSFAVTGIKVGDASISLRYDRENRRHIFRVRQDGGRIPFMLVFEPEVPEARIEDAFVDGPVADLVRSSARGRSRVRVQLPLAQERVITLVGVGEEDGRE